MTPPEGAVSSETPATATPPPQPLDPIAERRNHLAYLLTAIVCYVGFGLILPLMHYRPHRMHLPEMLLIFVAPTLAFMFLQMWIPWCLTRIKQELTWEIKELAVFGVMWLFLMLGFNHPSGKSAVVIGSLTNLAETITLGLIGGLIARIVREAKILLPLGIVAGLIDIVGAMTPMGFTNKMVNSHPAVVSHVSVHMPTVAGIQVATIGPGDLLFIAFFFAVVHRHKLNTRWTFRLVYSLLTLSMLIVQIFGYPIGALAPMGVGVIVANWKYFTYSREEKFAMLYASLISLAAAIGFFYYTHSHVFTQDPADGPAPRQTAPVHPSKPNTMRAPK